MNDRELRQFYREQMPKVYKFFYYKTLSRTVTEDLTGEVFLQFVSKLSDTAIEDNAKYLWSIAHNIFNQFLRDKYKLQSTTYDEEIFTSYVDEYIEERESIQTLEERVLPYIQLLPAKQQEVARLRLIEKNSLSDICLILKKDMNYVKTTQKRAIRKLKELVACTP